MSTKVNRLYADCTVDVRNLTLEQAVTEIEQCMIGVALGGLIEVIVGDREVADDLQGWANAAHHRMLDSSGGPDCQRIYLERQF